ncbi:ABC transporter ATP-binding protein [Catelliglobosispora koreensis]|uniref:ABC transporter ATP-binding protein n=1 Tax=Catelliglobosispora koreensis TaxID=129052 RepID=UPI00037ABBAE|nr:ABC transporter ATP-binding protein [Catelliglobosispora koreensis]
MINAKRLTVRYGQLTALDDVSIAVKPGEVAGVIGPNGAGKTTLLECIEGLRVPDSGEVTVDGLSPRHDRKAMTERAGVQLQHSVFPPRTLVSEICQVFASFYRDRADYNELLDRFGLAEHRKHQVTKLSGGQQQRLSLVLALLGNPKVVFLDELTTGLDPAARRVIWEELRQRNENGLTILLTSHHMEEVEYLCDHVTVLMRGRVVATGTPAGLVGEHSRESLEFTGSLGELAGVAGVTVASVGKRTLVKCSTQEARSEVDALLQAHNISARSLNPSLEDAYLNLTGGQAHVQ